MTLSSRRRHGGERCVGIALFILVGALLLGCSSRPEAPPLPPSESDLPLLQSAKICSTKTSLLGTARELPTSGDPWGTGEEIRTPTYRSQQRAEESYFLDEDGLLVGYFIRFPRDGLSLDPYPVLRDTLSQLPPTVEFYQDLSGLADRRKMKSATLYRTGDEKSTTSYLVAAEEDPPRLLSASSAIDPYEQLLSPYRREFRNRLSARGQTPRPTSKAGAGAKDEESFEALQQFARGETALLAYCGTRDVAIAADAYQKALAVGFKNPRIQAEAHHKLGLAMKGQGKLEPARDELKRSIEINPNRPDVLNNLGEIYEDLGQGREALSAFEKAVSLKPNYALARYNLAEAYEKVNVRRAVEEYETYLALAEGVPGEAERMARAERRLDLLKR